VREAGKMNLESNIGSDRKEPVSPTALHEIRIRLQNFATESLESLLYIAEAVGVRVGI
jgi:hypothetical protein